MCDSPQAVAAGGGGGRGLLMVSFSFAVIVVLRHWSQPHNLLTGAELAVLRRGGGVVFPFPPRGASAPSMLWKQGTRGHSWR